MMSPNPNQKEQTKLESNAHLTSLQSSNNAFESVGDGFQFGRKVRAEDEIFHANVGADIGQSLLARQVIMHREDVLLKKVRITVAQKRLHVVANQRFSFTFELRVVTQSFALSFAQF